MKVLSKILDCCPRLRQTLFNFCRSSRVVTGFHASVAGVESGLVIENGIFAESRVRGGR